MSLKLAIQPVTPFAQNCSVVWDEDTKKAAIVDAGGDVDAIMAIVEEQGLELEKLLVTHGHLDHVGAVADLAEKLGLPIEGPHEADRFWIDQLGSQAQMMNFPPSRSFEPDRWLNDGDTVTVGNISFDVIHCPGHTPGHVIFYNGDHKLAIVGDVLFQGSIGRTDFPQGNHADLISSIRDKLFPLGDDIAFIPGHGPTSTFGHERMSNPFVGDDAV